MNIILETQRCLLREFHPDDALEIFNLNTDPEVIRYTGDVAFENVIAAKLFIENYKDYILNNMGRWTVIRKSDQQFLGWCGLKLIREDNTIDLGYRFHRRFWNQGYATETSIACIDYGFKNLQLQSIIGRAEKENKASIHVLEKCGMHYVEDMIRGGKPQVLYEIFNHR